MKTPATPAAYTSYTQYFYIGLTDQVLMPLAAKFCDRAPSNNIHIIEELRKNAGAWV